MLLLDREGKGRLLREGRRLTFCARIEACGWSLKGMGCCKVFSIGVAQMILVRLGGCSVNKGGQ